MAHQVLAALPHGTWTSYGDLAAFIGSGPQAVGNHLAGTPGIVNAHRVLTAEGKVSGSFRWVSPDEEGTDVHARLRADGVHFTATGAADPAQHLTSDDLALLVSDTDGEDASSLPSEVAARADSVPLLKGESGEETRSERFFRQLSADDSEDTVQAVRALVAHWQAEGGWVGYGAGHVTTSAYLMLGKAGLPGQGIWPLTLYPGSGRGGTAEVVFKHMATREPFADRARRSELLARLNAMDGVDISEGKLELRPNFRLSLLGVGGNQTLLHETLTWFRQQWDGRGGR